VRYAVADAAGGDTGRLLASLRDTPIVLTRGELLLDKDLAIAVAGNAAVTVSGGDTSRVFEITVGAHVTLSGPTVTHGRGVADPGGGSDTGGEGGGILNAGTLTVSG